MGREEGKGLPDESADHACSSGDSEWVVVSRSGRAAEQQLICLRGGVFRDSDGSFRGIERWETAGYPGASVVIRMPLKECSSDDSKRRRMISLNLGSLSKIAKKSLFSEL